MTEEEGATEGENSAVRLVFPSRFMARGSVAERVFALVLAALTVRRVASWTLRPPDSLGAAQRELAKRVAAAAVLGAAVVLSPMGDNALALSNGGRVGGSSFSAPAYHYSAPAPSYHYSAPTPSYHYVAPTPSYYYSSPTPSYYYSAPTPSPSYYYSGSTAVSAEGEGAVEERFDLQTKIAIAGALTPVVVYGVDFFQRFSAERVVSVVKLQLALKSDWSIISEDWRKVLMDDLNAIAALNEEPTTPKEFGQLLHKSTNQIRYRENQIEAVSVDLSDFFWRPWMAQRLFQKWSIEERSKFETETSPYAPSIFDASLLGKKTPTKAVVTLIFAMRGDNSWHTKRLKALTSSSCSIAQVKDALTTISVVSDDYKENIVACEVLWTPSVRGTVVTDEEIAREYPQLRRL